AACTASRNRERRSFDDSRRPALSGGALPRDRNAPKSKGKRYYNGVRPPPTTICCSAVALTLALAVIVSTSCAARTPERRGVGFQPPATSKAKQTPLSFFPVQPLWTIALNNQITAGALPAFDRVHGFFPIEGDRIVAYDLVRGEQMWIATARTALPPAVGPDALFVVEPDRVIALRIADGSLAWQLPFSDPLAVPLVVDNGWLIADTIGGDVVSMRAADGALMWRQSI